MATKTILKEAKARLLFLAASIPKTTPPNPQLIQTIQPSNQQPLPHLSGLCQYLYQQPPSLKVDGLGLGGALDSTFNWLQARNSDNEEEDDVCDEEITDSEENDSSVESGDDEDDVDEDFLPEDFSSDEE